MNIGHIVVGYNSQDLNSGLTPSSVLFTVRHPREADDTKEERGDSCRRRWGAEPGRTQWFLPVSAQLCGAVGSRFPPVRARVLSCVRRCAVPGTAAFQVLGPLGLAQASSQCCGQERQWGRLAGESGAPGGSAESPVTLRWEIDTLVF